MRKISVAYFFLPLVLLFSLLLSACGDTNTGSTNSGPVTVHLGYFPNITHAVALVGVARGTFEQAFGKNVTLDTKQFNAGPALVEAMFAGSIDIGYVGPNPAINGYIQSKGQALRIIAGASSGGALFIVRPGITTAKDLAGKKIASPQLGGTQDISLRNYIVKNGLQTTDKGGTVQIIPLANADALTEFKAGQIDGAWEPEPWASRMVQEAKGKILVDERSLWPNGQFVTTNVIVSTKFLNQHPDLVTKFLEAHVDTVQYINANLADAKTLVNGQIKLLTEKALAPSVLNSSFNNLSITYDPLAQSLFTAADDAYNLGFLKAKPDQGIYDLDPLNAVLKAKGLPQVTA
jgi:NitT/TauT family transport system substrate-binding protein